MNVLQDSLSLKKYDTENRKIAVKNDTFEPIQVNINEDKITLNGKEFNLENRNVFKVDKGGKIVVFHSKKQVLQHFKLSLLMLPVFIVIFIIIIRFLF